MLGRKAYITLEKVHTTINGKSVWYIDGFGIVLVNGNRIYRLDNINLKSARDIMTMLATARDKKLKSLELKVGGNYCYSFIDIPKWAYQELIEQIWRYLY